MSKIIKAIFFLFITITQSHALHPIDMSQLADEMGQGKLIHSDEGESTVLAKDFCAIRDALHSSKGQVLEIDFLGADDLIPSAFELWRANNETPKKNLFVENLSAGQTTRLFSLNINSYPWENLFAQKICRDTNILSQAKMILAVDDNQVSISWQALCHYKEKIKKRSLTLNCTIDR